MTSKPAFITRPRIIRPTNMTTARYIAIIPPWTYLLTNDGNTRSTNTIICRYFSGRISYLMSSSGNVSAAVPLF
ncbi:unnamed protein product [Brugia timori]|uniref:Uncharacterized protein n=1 Tax=Brugia timori TaxID=42155 RepID=A0A0R3R7V2_9BILA|nr:unnamed protein product [Brugia timori]